VFLTAGLSFHTPPLLAVLTFPSFFLFFCQSRSEPYWMSPFIDVFFSSPKSHGRPHSGVLSPSETPFHFQPTIIPFPPPPPFLGVSPPPILTFDFPHQYLSQRSPLILPPVQNSSSTALSPFPRTSEPVIALPQSFPGHKYQLYKGVLWPSCSSF